MKYHGTELSCFERVACTYQSERVYGPAKVRLVGHRENCKKKTQLIVHLGRDNMGADRIGKIRNL